MINELKNILSDFVDPNTVLEIRTLESGLINNTFKVSTSEGVFVLQKMNQNVFPNIEALLNNKIKTTLFLKNKNFKTLEFLPTQNGNYFSNQNNEIWQLCKFIPSTTHLRITSDVMAQKVGLYLAQFHKALLDFPVSELLPTIPDFHNTVQRFENFLRSVEIGNIERIETAKDEILYLKDNYNKISKLAQDIQNQEIPLRAAHNDTKVANMLFDQENQIISIIDFDTMMPGSYLHDIGDALRTAANTSTEEEKDLSKVCLDINIYKSFMDAYLQEAKSFLSKSEIENIHLSLPLILFEQACRFLGDYLENDIYYHTTYEEQNLVRAKTQIKLFQEVVTFLES